MTFRSRIDYSGHVKEARSYPKTEPKYSMTFDKETGERTVIVSGQTNVYAAKQEALQDTLIYTLIDKYQRTGDDSLFGDAVAGFIDTVGLPKNLMEAENIRVQAEAIFKGLPMEDRARYNNSVGAFLKDVDSRVKANAAAALQAKREQATKEEEGATNE